MQLYALPDARLGMVSPTHTSGVGYVLGPFPLSRYYSGVVLASKYFRAFIKERRILLWGAVVIVWVEDHDVDSQAPEHL